MFRGTTLAVLLCALAVSVRAQTYYLISEMTNGMSGVPWPFNPYSSCPVYPQGNNKYWVDDRSSVVSFSSSGTTMTSDLLGPPDPTDTNNISTNYVGNGLVSPMDLSFLTNGSLWIEAYSNDTQNIYLQLHNTTNAFLYQIFSATNLSLPSTSWTPGQAQNGDSSTNVTVFNPVPMTNGQTFFRGERGDTVIFVDYTTVAYESNSFLGTPALSGTIEFSAQPGVDNPLTVHYSLGGSARNGIDYTNLSGVATIPGSGIDSVQVSVQPISPTTLTNPIETVDFAVQPSSNYLVAPFQYTGTVLIKSSSMTASINCPGQDAVRPTASGQPDQDGTIYFSRLDDFGTNPPVTVYYQISGTASNGLDYQLLSGSLTFAQGSTSTNITIVPFAENPLQGTKTVTATLISSNGYVADSNNFSCTINIFDQTNTVGISSVEAAINSDGPPGEPVQQGAFDLSRFESHGFLPQITVGYSMGGEAVNGVDYSALTGAVTFAEGEVTVSVPIDPISHWTNATKSVIMTLLPGSSYTLDANATERTNFIQNSSTGVFVQWQQDAVEPQGTNPAVPGIFSLQRGDGRGFTPPLSVFYKLGGYATNGVDYTNLSGVITFADGQFQTNLYVWPITNSAFPGDKTVTITLLPGTNYFVDTIDGASASMLILDNNVQFQTVTDLPGGPIGIDYDPYLRNLIFSGGMTFQFNRLGTNITIVGGIPVTNLFTTNWSGIAGLPDEVYNIVVTNNASGFTNGDMFFGSDTGVGWLSSNAAASNLSWCVLTNAQETNALLLRGGLNMDTVGTFSNNLVAVTSDDSLSFGTKGVWEVDSHGHPTLLTNIDAFLLEGITVVRTNFGPWSGQIITGDEGSGLIYTIDNHGNATTNDSAALFPGGIYSESIQVIPPNQSLYLCNPLGTIAKLPKSYFTSYVGDLLIEDGGENSNLPAKLFIIHWDAVSHGFITRRIRYNFNGILGESVLEHCVFAPIELPAH